MPAPLLELEAPTKVQPRRSRGRHTRWRQALLGLTQLAFYGLPWLRWDGAPALHFDLEARRFSAFGAVFLPHDLVWLTALLVASALALFFATALAGRVWCGFACPQTVYTALFRWIETRCEGDRQARLRLDAGPWRPAKLVRRGGKHLLWALLSLWSGLSLVGYFTPIRELLAALPSGLGPWEAFWCLFYGLAMYLHAGWLQEKVCLHMCPYGRFQGALMDAHTLNVSYDAARGEPRGARGRTDGACIDCTLCVQVCPVGIDIREGLQAACINCGVCIDACDAVMDRLGQPRGLIRFASMAELSRPGPARPPASLGRQAVASLARPRTALYGLLLLATVSALVIGLAQRPTLRLDAMRDRRVLAREVEDGQVENVYQLLLMNASGRPRHLALAAAAGPGAPALPGLQLLGPDTLTLAPAEARSVAVRLRLPAATALALRGRVLPVLLTAQELPAGLPGRGESARTTTTLLLPG